MHFEILVEDKSGKALLDILVPKIIGQVHSARIIAYRGVGDIPKGPKKPSQLKNRLIINNLKRLLGGYGNYCKSFLCCVIVVIDLDRRNKNEFLSDLNNILISIMNRPIVSFCLAIEEMEAWLLGDSHAIKKAYPKANNIILNSYKNDSIFGTWEKLADAIHPDGAKKLKENNRNYSPIGILKMEWAKNIAPHMA